MFQFLKSLLPTKQKPVYGSRIFEYRSWLTRQVDEAVWKRQYNLD